MKKYERELPPGYKEVFNIDATSKKTGLIFNGIALVIAIVTVLVGCIPLFLQESVSFKISSLEFLLLDVIFLVSMIVYMVLHELTHGAAYKLLTGEKLTFGLSWSCAFCGVPNIYVYRQASLIALVAPLILFTIVFSILSVVLFFAGPAYYILSLILFGLHLGGCAGDGYVTLLFLLKFKDRRTLIRDTGPKQYIYVTEDK